MAVNRSSWRNLHSQSKELFEQGEGWVCVNDIQRELDTLQTEFVVEKNRRVFVSCGLRNRVYVVLLEETSYLFKECVHFFEFTFWNLFRNFLKTTVDIMNNGNARRL